MRGGIKLELAARRNCAFDAGLGLHTASDKFGDKGSNLNL
jgi:hypothetical protein